MLLGCTNIHFKTQHVLYMQLCSVCIFGIKVPSYAINPTYVFIPDNYHMTLVVLVQCIRPNPHRSMNRSLLNLTNEANYTALVEAGSIRIYAALAGG